MNQPSEHITRLNRIQRSSLFIGTVFLLIVVAGAYFDVHQFFRSYLFAYLVWIGFALGCFGVLMLQHLTGGSWGLIIQRVLESGSRTMPFMALLFAPIFLGVLFGVSDLYEWARPEAVARSPLLQQKHLYLNVPFFLIRAVFYFAVWMAFIFLLSRWSADQDRTGEASLSRRMQVLSAPGLILYVLTTTFAAIDWVMSLEPEWFSTIYGITFVVGQTLAAISLSIAVLVLLAGYKPFSDILSPSHYHDLGNLLLAFVMLWAYIEFSQFLIIWAGNLPEEIPWYLRRMEHGWQWLALFLIVFYFAVPFVLLLMRATKRRPRNLSKVAVAIVIVRVVDLFWVVVPAFSEAGLHVHWMDLAALISLGGLWIAVFIWYLKGRALLPLRDPRLEGAFEHV